MAAGSTSRSPRLRRSTLQLADPKVDELITKIHYAASETDSGAAVKELNTYMVDQAWFAPWYRQESNFALDAETVSVPQVGNAYPYLWNFTPKS